MLNLIQIIIIIQPPVAECNIRQYMREGRLLSCPIGTLSPVLALKTKVRQVLRVLLAAPKGQFLEGKILRVCLFCQY